MKLLSTVLFLVGLLPAVAAFAALVGLGLGRDLPVQEVAAAAGCLVVLPILGLHSRMGRSGPALGLAMLGWSAALLAGLPGYFPGEVREAIGTGAGVLFAMGGPDATASAARFARGIPLSTDGKSPAPLAKAATQPCVPVATALGSDQVALPYEGQGHSMAVPVQFGETELPMLFDTGATVTTLSRDALRNLGIDVPASAPEITLRTANGERSARLVLVPRVWVGGLPVDGVTVGVCDECADEKVRGLLGLNVSGQFLVTVDTARREVVFQSRQGRQDRVVDVGPWLKVHATARVWPDERVEVEVVADNAANRTVTEAVIGIHCARDNFEATLANITPGATATTEVRLPAGTDCQEYRVTLDHAYW